MASRHKMVLGLALVGLGGLAVLTEYQSEALSRNSATSGAQAPFAFEMEYSHGELAEYPRAALPRTFPGSWVNYSTIAVQNKLKGRLSYRVTVDPYGEVAECEVVNSSGVPAVDRRVCGSIIDNARFYPAMDANQEPVRGTYEGSEVFELSGLNTYIGVLATIGSDGTIEDCHWANAEFASGDPMPACLERLEVWQRYAREHDIPMLAARDVPLSFPPELLEVGRTVR